MQEAIRRPLPPSRREEWNTSRYTRLSWSTAQPAIHVQPPAEGTDGIDGQAGKDPPGTGHDLVKRHGDRMTARGAGGSKSTACVAMAAGTPKWAPS